MHYRQYSLPRSVSLERANDNFTISRRPYNLSRNLWGNYSDARSNSARADSVLLNGFSRALSLSPGQISSKEHVPMHHFLERRRTKRYSSFDNDIPLPTSSLKAHVPIKYEYVLEPDNESLNRNRFLSSLDISDYPRNVSSSWYPRSGYFHNQTYPTLKAGHSDYNLYSRLYPRRSYGQWNPKTSYIYNQSYPQRRELYPLRRIPESSSFYTYRVLPLYDYNANDIIRARRRRLEDKSILNYDFPEPPIGTFSNMKQSINNVLDKIDKHKLLLDRYAGIDLTPNSTSVSDNIMEKSRQMSSYKHRY